MITLKTGEKITSKYASKSFASSNPAPEQVYLEERWFLKDDDSFDRERNGTAGIIILSAEIATVELIKYN
ncbi:DUF6338 family protein [Shewanella mangrovisoli]|uniref:DUF6338 family protein n=1 Tax=Shewanella mangrovisoli TaxID=2864211 RepID=UPI0035B9124D